jgi:3-oxoacyl-[acyl-carrier protein] reductase
MTRLVGKTALVTGGGRGIGRAVSRRLAEEGARVVVHYGSNQAAAQATVAEISGTGGDAVAIHARFGAGDPTGEAEALWAAFDTVAAGVDVLVNNAGVANVRGTIEDTTPDGLQRLLALNTVAPFFVTRAGLSRLSDGGRIVNVSTHLTRGAAQPDLIAYSMSKGAVDVFTATLAKQLGPRRVTVNAVAPGVVDTDMNAAWLDHARDTVAGLSPLGRIAQPADVGDIVAFLASDDARWVTGQHIDASGGALL